jgi:UDP-2,3-diacylglucosamine hydrolase
MQFPSSVESGKKIYFASDQHLGVPTKEKSLAREKLFIQWLDEVSKDAQCIFLMGDLFDFWFEYKQVVPKGFVRVLGKLAELSDKKIPIYFFPGNHDQWMKNYFQDELNIPIIEGEVTFTCNEKKFHIGHGDGLGPGDYKYKQIKKIFHSPFFRWLFARLHPNFAVWLGKKWSYDNRFLNGEVNEKFLGEEKEWLIGYSREKLKHEHIDYFLFGHRHLAMDYKLSDTSKYINTGDWLRFNSYAEFDGKNLELKYYQTQK